MLRPVLLAILILAILGPAWAAAAPPRPTKRPGTGNEVEGAIWQYTATIAKKDQKMTGKFRISGKAIFAVSGRPVLAQNESRIGDVITSQNRPMQLVFTDHPELDGRALVEWNQKTSMWVGHYDEKNGTRWKFELRRADD
jgi:hypothetical protein